MNEKIGVFGCGWLGFPLAKHFVVNTYEVHGTTTSKEKLKLLKKDKIHPYEISISATKIHGDIETFLSNIDVLIINIPPKLRGANTESFVEKIKLLHNQVKKSKISKIIFVSSTAVYGNISGDVTEETPPIPVTESGKQLLECEQLLTQDSTLQTTIVRFGGLIGPTRHPVTMLSKRKNLTNGNDPVNLIHLQDCIHLIYTIIEKGYWGEIFNGVYPLHPTKKEYYTTEAIRRGIPAPNYLGSLSHKNNKIIRSKNFMDKSHYFQTSIVT
ncbi:SDR family oxidoreductase [Flagellimonas pacifica]|uniref:Nucleoside-diphosphate-sugar epimerase n=1 Tax=Flagellimonas pacifica TaxID=1247520 RepID=A0A285MDT0_9FLAO|nr:SDR family oxidoreductase [Allomuricauda parva]SNY95332.1 Nucleoside-diphosphate-sugar epimerase [Allomuricauda parva]